MGYTIPNTEEKINEALNAMTELNQPGMIDSMRTLINAYEDRIDPLDFGANQKNWFHELYNVQNQLGLTNGKSEDELFPADARTSENFGNTFRQLWNSISMYHELKQTSPELAEQTSIAELHQNFPENYRQILIEKDMFDSLKEVGHFDFGEGPDKYRSALKNLNLYQAAHKGDEPFSESELEDIQKETKALNLPFIVRGTASEGVFVGSGIKTPADLQNYIDRYETMMRDFMEVGGNNLHLYAQRYNPAEHDVQKLSEHDLRVAKLDLHHQEMREQESPIYRAYAQLENEKKFKETIEKETGEAISAFDQLDASSRQQFDNDRELKEAQAVYNQEVERCQKLAAHYTQIRKDDLREAGGIFRLVRENEEMRLKINDYKDAIMIDAVSFSNAFQKDRLRESAIVKQAASNYTRNMKGNMKDVQAFRREMMDTITEQRDRQRKLNENPQAPEYEQQQLNREYKNLAKKVDSKVKQFEEFRENEKNDLSRIAGNALQNLQQSYADEKADRLQALKTATEKLQAARKDMSDFYMNTGIAARHTQKLQKDLKETLNAMTGVKKFSFLGIGGNDSGAYTTMVNAMNNYLDGKLSAADAHKACEGYLAKHTDKQGKLKDMSSELGRLRKQGCVRMMELLSQDPSYIAAAAGNEVAAETLAETKEAEGSTMQSTTAQRTKIDYETLKQELSAKSAELKKPSNKKDAKAYSDLNQQIKKQKDKEKAKADKKKAPKEKAPKEKAAPKKEKATPAKRK